MARFIRYMEDDVWKYASVKDVGDLTLLKTLNKTDLVSAVNNLIDGEVAVPISSELSDRLDLMKQETDGLSVSLTDATAEQAIHAQAIEDARIKREEMEAEISTAKEDIIKKADLTYVNGELTKKIDDSKYQEEYDAVKSSLLEKVDESTYRTEYDAIVSSVSDKVEQSNFNNLEGKFNTVENKVVDMEGEISTKITQVDFDDAFGVNQWVASRYDITGTNLAETSPTFGLIKGMNASQVESVEDAQALSAYTGASIITHYFTNVKLTLAKTITLQLKYKDSVSVYMNGANVYEGKGNGIDIANVYLSLRQGWNTIEILHGISTSDSLLDLGSTISSLVEKMTTTIGVGDKDETRLALAETEIKQTSDAILLKADKTDITAMGNRVSETESSIEVLNDSITSKVEKTDFNAYSQRVSDAETRITQTEDSIEQKVEKTDYNLLNDKVTSHSTAITQLEGEIDLKVSQEDYNGLDGRVESAETQINLNKSAIELKASQTDLNTVSGRLTKAEASLTIANDEIATKVSQTEFDNMEISDRNLIVRTGEIEGAGVGTTGLSENFYVSSMMKEFIPVTSGDKLAFSQVKESDGDSYFRIGYYTEPIMSPESFVSRKAFKELEKYETVPSGANWLRVSYDNRNLVKLQRGSKVSDWTPAVEDVDAEISGLEGRMKSAETSITQTAEAIELKADAETVYNKTEVDGKISTVVSDTNTKFTQTNNSINLKANSTDVYTKSQVNTELGKKADGSDLSALVTRVESAESEINQQSDEIALRVTKTEFDNMEIGGRNYVINSSDERVVSQYTLYPISSASSDLNGELVTVSFDAKREEGSPSVNLYTYFRGSSPISPNSEKIGDVTTEYKRYVTYIPKGTGREQAINVAIHPSITGVKLSIKNVKLEKGNKATDWTPAPEDVNANIESAVSTAKSEIKITTDGISQTVSSLSKTVNSQGDTLSSHTTAINQMDGQISLKADSSTVTTELGKKATQDDIDSSIDKIEVGGRNLFVGSSQDDTPITVTTYGNTGYFGVKSLTSLGLTNGDPVSVSAYFSSVSDTDGVKLRFDWMRDDGSYSNDTGKEVASSRGRIHHTSVIPESKEFTGIRVRIYPVNYVSSFSVMIRKFKLEKGNKATDWTPAPEDVDASIGVAQNTADSGVSKANAAQSTANNAKSTADTLKNTTVPALATRMQSAEQKITADAITSTVTSSSVYKKDVNDTKLDGGWVNNYSVNLSTAKELIHPDGSPFNDAYTYEIQARTTGTGTESTAIGVFKSKGDGNGWALEIIYQMATGSNHPDIFLDSSGKPSIKTWHSSMYNIEVHANRYRGRESKSGALASRMSSAEQKITDSAIVSTVTSSSTYKNALTGKVSTNSIISSINQTAETIQISASKIDIRGAVTFSSFDSSTQSKVNNIEKAAGDANSKIDSLEIGGRNLLILKDITRGRYLVSNGGYTSSSAWFHTDYIPVSGYKELIASGFSNLGNAPSVCYYDSSKNFVKGINNASQSRGSRMTIDSGIHYIRFSGEIGDLGTLKIEKGNKATDWTPAPEDVDDGISQAKSDASSAKSTASSAASTANTANSNASAAVSTANTANSNASSAKSSASSAVSTANSASSTANTAKSTADSAKSTANTANSNASSALSKANSVEGKINNAVTTIDGTGVTVRDGSFFLEDRVSSTKYTVTSARNLVKDHSFELVNTSDNIDDLNIKYNWTEMNGSIPYNDSPWTKHGYPKVALRHLVASADGMPTFGEQAIAVRKGDYVKQQVYSISPSTTYTLSGFFKRQFGVVSGGTPQLEAWHVDATGSRVGSSLVHQTFSPVKSDYTLERHSVTFKTPSSLEVYEGIEIVVISGNSEYVQCDGVQLVEGSYPSVYQPEDSIWEISKGSYRPMSKQRILWTGERYPLSTSSHDIYPDLTLPQCANGWIIEWEAYIVGQGSQDRRYHHSLVPKTHVSLNNGDSMAFRIPQTQGTDAFKYLYIYYDHIRGYDGNNSGDNSTAVISAIYEF